MMGDKELISVQVLFFDEQMPAACGHIRRLKLRVTELQTEPRRTVRLTLEGEESVIDEFNRKFGVVRPGATLQ